MELYVVVIFTGYSLVMDFDVLEDEKQAVRSFYKIKKDFDKDKFASEMILQKLIFEDKFNYKRFNYKDLVLKAVVTKILLQEP